MRPRAHRAGTFWRFLASAIAAASMVPAPAAAYDFKLAPAEWAMWPDYCKARYVTTEVGKRSQYAPFFPPAGVQRWKSLLGEQTFTMVHHYCAGIIWLQRSSVASSEQQRTYMLRNAESECRFTFERIPPTSPIYREVVMNLQLAQAMLGTASARTVPR